MPNVARKPNSLPGVVGARGSSSDETVGVRECTLKVFMALQNIKYIVPALRNFRAKTNSTAFVRRAFKLNYAKANQRWWIHVECDSDIDLYILEKALSGSEIRLVELENKFYVEDPRIPDSADMGEATRLAETVIAQLNGVTCMLCQHFQGARIESMVELLDNGTGRGILSGDRGFPQQ
jgi:hypothetical protein